MNQTFQPVLFDFSQVTSGAVELFPAVWSALEDITSPVVSSRQKGLSILVEMNAARLSALVAYVIATRLDDPDLSLRSRVVQVLADVLTADSQGHLPLEPVRLCLSNYLARMRQRPIYGLLQVIEANSSLASAVARLLNANSFAGNHLVEILTDRKSPMGIRKQAIIMIGQVGYLDALPALERMLVRLEARLQGQQSMPFAPPASAEETELLPELQKAVRALR